MGKKHHGFYVWIVLSLAILTGIYLMGRVLFHPNADHKSTHDSTSLSIGCAPIWWELPDTSFPSVGMLNFTIYLLDSLIPGTIKDTTDLYSDIPGIFTFRGSPFRDHPMAGTLRGIPDTILQLWHYSTDFDTTLTDFGVWGGGTGWTGQPLVISWPDSLKKQMNPLIGQDIHHIPDKELIFGSLCGKVYFLDEQTGKPSRVPLHAINPIKGTPSLDPKLNGNLYVGHGIPRSDTFGFMVFNLLTHTNPQLFSGNDKHSLKRWGAFDSSPLVLGNFLFWPAENGILYKFHIEGQKITPHSKLVYRREGKNAPGIESSLAVYHHYGYFGDNHGNIICVNLNNMKPVWCFQNLDDTDASLVVEVTNGIPYVYTGCEVDKQGHSGSSRLVKLNGLTGEPVWLQSVRCYSVTRNQKTYNGGLLATPLLGQGNCSDRIFANFSQTDSTFKGDLIAFDKQTGEELYRTRLDAYSWSSPVPFINEKSEMYIVTGDVQGNVYIIEGKTGKILYKTRIGSNFESSPLVIDDCIIFGSRGRSIFKLRIQ